MKIEVTINNYQLGAKLKTTPTHKIISQNRIDSKHIVICYDDINRCEKELIEKVFSKKVKCYE